MAAKLKSCTGLDAVNDTMWAASNYGSFVQGMVQYNLEGANDVAAYCAEMTKPGRAPIDSFAAVIAAAQGGQCMDSACAAAARRVSATCPHHRARLHGPRPRAPPRLTAPQHPRRFCPPPPDSYADYLALLRNTTADRSANGLGLRQWTWQCCTQFSYWQDCDKDTACPLSKAFMTLDSNTQQCQDAFGPGVSRFLNERTTRFTVR